MPRPKRRSPSRPRRSAALLRGASTGHAVTVRRSNSPPAQINEERSNGRGAHPRGLMLLAGDPGGGGIRPMTSPKMRPGPRSPWRANRRAVPVLSPQERNHRAGQHDDAWDIDNRPADPALLPPPYPRLRHRADPGAARDRIRETRRRSWQVWTKGHDHNARPIVNRRRRPGPMAVASDGEASRPSASTP